MIYTVKQKIIDNIIVFMLVMSTGGLLFVFNRNLSYLVFFCILILAYIFFGKKLNSSVVNSSILSLVTICVLFIVNYIFAINAQSDNKYLYYLMIISISILVLSYFKNNRNYNILIERIYSVLKIIMIHSFLNFIAFFVIKNNLTIITSNYHKCFTFMIIRGYYSEVIFNHKKSYEI